MIARLFVILAALLVAGQARAAPAVEGYIHTSDGARLFYKVVGRGPPLVVVHGGPANSFRSIEPDLAPLADRRQLIFYDQRGNGRSSLVDDPARLSLAHHVADLETVRRHFALDRITLLGNSWGGLLAAAYAGDHPERVERLILHSPAEPTMALLLEAVEALQARAASRFTPAERRRFALLSEPRYRLDVADPVAACREWAAMLLPLMVARPEAAGRIRGDVCAGSEQAVRVQQIVNMQIWRSLGDFDLRPRMRAFRAPVLVVHGVADTIPVDSSAAWAAAFADSRLLLIEGAGHAPHVERPELFFAAVETFLAGRWPAGARRVARAPPQP